MKPLEIRRLGRLDYSDALALQEDLVARRLADEIGDTLLLLEHPSLFTTGRGTDAESLPRGSNIPIISSNRGGNITWHGPGQRVGYWIRKLEGAQRDLHAHLRLIEMALIAALEEFDVVGTHRDGLTGVWIEGRKIASIGVAVRSWVTYHGFALNREVDPGIYREFRPCGLDGALMTDLSRETAALPCEKALDDALERAFTALHKS